MTAYRTRMPSVLVAIVSVGFAISSVATAVSRPGDVSVAARWAPVVLICAISAFCLWRLARAGVFVGEEGIRVLNPFYTVEIPWKRVRRFDLRRHKGFPALGFVDLLDGDPVQVWGIQARSRNPAATRQAQEVVDALNARLAEMREAAPQ